ncbi:MAG: hypothetical protein PHQ40_19465 [Anaerolineaceae bacterium]|nr:hypothetical protein [Anaerolineaceae bacterium]
MKTMGSFKKVILGGLLVTLLAAGLLLAPNLAAQAASNPQTGNPPATQPAQPQTNPLAQVHIEKIYQRELTFLAAQGKRLERTDTLVGKAEALLQKLAGKGINVSPLQAALDDFKATIPSARAVHLSAEEILNQHAGLDANGKVTDLKTARETVLTAGQDLRECHRILKNAFADLIKEIRQFRTQNRTVLQPGQPSGTQTNPLPSVQ